MDTSLASSIFSCDADLILGHSNEFKLCTSILLDGVVLKAGSLFVSASGRAATSGLAKIMKSPLAEECIIGISTVGKIAIEDGTGVAKITTEVIKNNPALLGQKGKPITQIVREVAKDVVETKDFGKVITPTGEKSWLRLGVDQLKKIGPRSNQTSIREIFGTPKDSWDFFKAQVISPVEKKPGLFYGKNPEGIGFSHRFISKTPPYGPTIDIVGVEGLKKIKFKN